MLGVLAIVSVGSVKLRWQGQTKRLKCLGDPGQIRNLQRCTRGRGYGTNASRLPVGKRAGWQAGKLEGEQAGKQAGKLEG
jgi:hypothetical protein